MPLDPEKDILYECPVCKKFYGGKYVLMAYRHMNTRVDIFPVSDEEALALLLQFDAPAVKHNCFDCEREQEELLLMGAFVTDEQ